MKSVIGGRVGVGTRVIVGIAVGMAVAGNSVWVGRGDAVGDMVTAGVQAVNNRTIKRNSVFVFIYVLTSGHGATGTPKSSTVDPITNQRP